MYYASALTSLSYECQFIALQDLALLSRHSPPRRCEVFSLSQPGVWYLTTRNFRPFYNCRAWFESEQNTSVISCLLQVAILTTGTPSVKSACACWPIWTSDLYPIMTPWQPMAEPSHYLLEVKGRHHRRHQVWQLDNIFAISFFLLYTVSLCDSLKLTSLCVSLKVTSGTEDPMSPRPTFLMKTPVSVFARTIGGTPKSPLTPPFTPDLGSPFTSPALRRLTAPAEQCSPWSGTLQSPHAMRRGVKLWSTSTGEASSC